MICILSVSYTHLDDSQTQIIDVEQVGDAGVGIKEVVKTPYEVTANLVVPEGKTVDDYMLVISDADGDILPYQGDSTFLYNIYQKDTDRVYVFVCCLLYTSRCV